MTQICGSQPVDLAGSWKHGWIPLDGTALKSKYHGRVPSGGGKYGKGMKSGSRDMPGPSPTPRKGGLKSKKIRPASPNAPREDSRGNPMIVSSNNPKPAAERDYSNRKIWSDDNLRKMATAQNRQTNAAARQELRKRGVVPPKDPYAPEHGGLPRARGQGIASGEPNSSKTREAPAPGKIGRQRARRGAGQSTGSQPKQNPLADLKTETLRKMANNPKASDKTRERARAELKRRGQ